MISTTLDPLYGRRRILLIAASLAMASVLLSAPRAAGASDPADVVREVEARAIAAIAEPSPQTCFRRILAEHFDLDLLSRFVLGKHWRQATADQRREFRQLFEDFVLAFYSERMSRYSGERLEIKETEQRSTGRAVVRSELHGLGGAPLQIDWRVHEKDGHWRIVDVTFEGVSLAVTRRSEFDSVIRNNGGRIEALLVKLRDAVT